MSTPEPEIDAAKDIQMWLEDCILNRPMTAQEVCHLGIKCRFWQLTILRDYFAAAAIGPLMASDGFEKVCMGIDGFNLECDLPKFAAQEAYRIADAMLREREKR